MSYDREERPKTTQAPAKPSQSAAPKPKQWGGESGLGKKPTDEMLRAIFGGVSRVADSGVPDMGKGNGTSRDETEVNWGIRYQEAPYNYVHLDCVLAQGGIPLDPDRQALAPRRVENGEIDVLGDFAPHDVDRTKYWLAIGADSLAVHSAHEALGPEIHAFTHAERDEQMRALLYLLPGENWQGDASTLTDAQSVPKRGGVKVRDLFGKNDDLTMTAHDKSAIASTAKATRKGKGNTEAAASKTTASDNAVKGRLAGVRAQVENAKAASNELEAALAVVTQLQAQDDADEAKKEIAELQEEAAAWREGVDIVSSLVTAVVYDLNEDYGDAIDKVGVLVSTIVSHLNADKLDKAQKKLESAEKRYKDARVSEAALRVNGARSRLKGSLADVDKAKAELLETLSARRDAYNDLGTTAAAEIDCPGDSGKTISGMMAAIPLVELVIARARSIRIAAATPAYSKASGVGLGIARYHQEPNVDHFLRCVGELRWARGTFEKEEQRWQKRLTQLLAVKEQIIGSRPGD